MGKRRFHTNCRHHAGKRCRTGRQTWDHQKSLNILDLGCGDGTTAIPEAKLGANVSGVDIVKNLVEAANKRA
jgi:2-polyprenyl-3-methyl-5-hydroxy-6-metoxy-1,4-benzoquinol methylase